jgi:uncharacterized cysteine cluster protein YcgN (CxxCxxCC family)
VGAAGGLRTRWEAICRRCGRCCFQKVIRDGVTAANYRAPCRFLDRSSRLCTVYDSRFTRCSECRKMTVFHAIFASYLPEGCGYVMKFRPAFLRGSKGRRPKRGRKERAHD